MLAWWRKSYLKPAEIMYMSDGPIETIECIWVNIWYMLDWIWSQNCRNTLLLHKAGQLVRSAKIGTLFVYPTGDQTWMEQYLIVKSGISIGAGCIMY